MPVGGPLLCCRPSAGTPTGSVQRPSLFRHEVFSVPPVPRGKHRALWLIAS
jgi:hypothetical protein